MKINRNMSAVITNNQLLRSEKKVAIHMERLSSGFKINHASDNPAGIAISNKMRAQIDALERAESNASDATSVLQIADGALNEVTSILQRMRELAVQAGNGTYGYEDRISIQEEIDELQKEVDRISNDTEYNTKTLLDGSSDVRVYADNAERFYVSDSVTKGDYRINVEKMAVPATIELAYPEGAEGTMSINGVSIEVTSSMSNESYLEAVRNAAEEVGCLVESVEGEDGTPTAVRLISQNYGSGEEIQLKMNAELANATGISKYTEELTIEEDGTYTLNKYGENAVVSLPKDIDASGFTTTTTVYTEGNRIKITDGSGFEIDFCLNEKYTLTEPTEDGNYEIEVSEIGAMTIQIGANEFQTMDVRICEISAKSLYVDTIDVSKVNGASRALNTLDEAIKKVSATRSRMGAFQNRLEYAANGLAETQENMTAAYSGLMDTDMADEMTKYTQQNVINQAAISVLAQANELPQQILSLLQ